MLFWCKDLQENVQLSVKCFIADWMETGKIFTLLFYSLCFASLLWSQIRLTKCSVHCGIKSKRLFLNCDNREEKNYHDFEEHIWESRKIQKIIKSFSPGKLPFQNIHQDHQNHCHHHDYRIEPQSRPIGAGWGWSKRRSPENYHHRDADNHHDDDDPDNNDDHDDDNNYNGDDDDVDDDEDDVDTGTLK